MRLIRRDERPRSPHVSAKPSAVLDWSKRGLFPEVWAEQPLYWPVMGVTMAASTPLYATRMKDSAQIMAEINHLLAQQAEALKGKLGVLEVVEYADRTKRIRELFDLLRYEVLPSLPRK